MKKPFPAYEGNEPYVFVCYAHKDSDKVYSDMSLLHDENIHIWYDEGIAAGVSWRSKIAAAIKGTTKFIFYISEASLTSAHCLREVDYALNHDIEMIPVYLDDSLLPDELELVLNRVQALYREKDLDYIPHLIQGLRQKTPLTQLLTKTKKRNLRFYLPWAAIVFSALLLFVWAQRDSIFPDETSGKSLLGAPNAYDAYLEGLDLLKRWDKEGNLDQAISLFQKASELDPDFALAYARLAEALRISYALSGDEALLEQAVDNVNEAVRLNAGLAPVQVALGRIQATQGNVDLAFAALERALAIDANDAEANVAIAKLYGRLGRLQDAEVSFKKAVALDPENPSSINSYANFLFGESRYEEASSQWQTVIRLAPDHYAALLNLGTVFDNTGKLAEAITVYERSIEIKPTYMGYSNLGTAYSRSNRFPDAIEAYEKAIEIDDSDGLAWGNLAFVYSWMNGMDSQAKETFEHAIELAEAARLQNPRSVFVHADLALYYAKTKQPVLSQQRLETALALAPDSAEVLTTAAEVYELLGQRERAVEYVRKALELGIPTQQLLRNQELTDLFKDPAMADVL